ncbi:MAG: hypothetical protein EU549_00610 [Promethearchaeota archaeon]|nr:MAG: hypothetical protein EU549_00610 [Candidatus Lokiarchaeota archaeon]
MKSVEDGKSDKNLHEAKTYTGIYRMHKYWSKKPYNIVRTLIKRYSKNGEIILDPFCGSGISINESILLNRKSIGIDINPIAIFITKQLLTKISVNDLNEEFKSLKDDVRSDINSSYKVSRGDNVFVGTHFLWSEGELVEVRYRKHNSRKKILDEPTKKDVDLAKSFTKDKISKFYPNNKLIYNTRINAQKNMRVCDLFSNRNLYSLSILLDRINKIKKRNIRDILRFCFTSALGQTTKMVFVIKKRGGKLLKKKQLGSWIIGYWIPDEHFELNVWNCFENKFRIIKRAKLKQKKLDYRIKASKTFDDLSNKKNLLLLNAPSQKALKKFPDDSIDYIITDPPHGNRQPFLELSMIWNSWLNFEVNYEDEIVISFSKERHKSSQEYYKLITLVFREIERVLKPNRYFTLMFNSLDKQSWESLFQCIDKFNFEMDKTEYLNYSSNSVLQDTRKFSLKKDFILTFKKIAN